MGTSTTGYQVGRRIALGTVQFGLNYGVSNQTGQTSFDEARSILATASALDIDTIDTAIAYGDSEIVLGKLGLAQMNVITKLPAVPANCTNVQEWVFKQVADSLARLQINQLGGLLLHHPKQLLDAHGRDLYSAMQSVRKAELVKKIGISIYEPSELEALLNTMKFDIVQAPLNLLDTRLVTSGWLDRLLDLNMEIHTRSAFLQGLLLMPAGTRPAYFEQWSAIWNAFESWLTKYQISPLEACIRFALSFSGIGKVVVGAQSRQQLESIVFATSGELPPVPDVLGSMDAKLINPANWVLQ